MAEQPDHGMLYQETLDTAQMELEDLTAQIEQLRGLLTRLENRKKAVEDICNAIGRWVEISETLVETDVMLPSSVSDEIGMVALTEEEVSLIAYPPERARSPESQ